MDHGSMYMYMGRRYESINIYESPFQKDDANKNEDRL